ncbi:MAG: 4Fe-4S binding protein [Acidobacteria bacterium]|nr:4Fe-4S binding protein [Acidobacteriota bacterium]
MKNGCQSSETKKGRSIELPVLPVDAGKNPIRKSRVSPWRAAVLIGLTLLMIAHIAQWLWTGRTLSPIEPSETMATLQRGTVNAGFIFFTLAILATLVFGRFVCGWGCHIVALQDLCAWLLKKVGLRPRPFRSRLLVFVPLLTALYMFVWPTFARFLAAPKNEPLIPEFTNHLITSEYWATFPPLGVVFPFLFVCGFMTVYFLGSKGFCTYACPYGGFFELADRLAPGRIRVNKDACQECGHCTAVCTSNVLVHAEVRDYGMVVDRGCMKCMDCVSVCPNDALYFGFGRPSLGAGKRAARQYSLTWPEELAAALVFAASLWAVWDVYQLVPMLMALGIASVSTYLAMRVVRLFRAGDLSFYRYNLKAGGKLKTAGWVFLGFAALWLGLNAHSGYVRYHEAAGARAYQDVRIPDELALARTNPARWLSAADRENIEAGRRHFGAARAAGLLTNTEALPKFAWLEYLNGNSPEAVRLLGLAAARQTGAPRALSLYYQGAILNRLRRYNEALASLDGALKEAPELVLAHEERGEALWMLGRRDEAQAAWNDAVGLNSDFALANDLLAGAAMAAGRTDEALVHEKQAADNTPEDPLFHWVLGLRLQNVGMEALAEKHFQEAIRLNPEFKKARLADAPVRN